MNLKDFHTIYVYSLLWLFVGYVSSYDMYLAIKNQNILLENEQNPIGRYLIIEDGGSVALFMSVKFFGTVLTLGFLSLLYKYKENWAWISMIALCFFQFILLCFINESWIVGFL